jgi:hypothetical protein
VVGSLELVLLEPALGAVVSAEAAPVTATAPPTPIPASTSAPPATVFLALLEIFTVLSFVLLG